MATSGQVGISVFPNLLDFHKRVEKAVRKAEELKIDIDVDIHRAEFDKLRKDVEDLDNRSVLIKAKVDLDDRELDQFMGRDLRQTVNVDVDVDNATRNLNTWRNLVSQNPVSIQAAVELSEEEYRNFRNRVNAESLVVDSVLDLSTERARRVMEDFKDDYEEIHTHLVVDRYRADEEMDDFRQRQFRFPIRQRIIYETSSVPDAPKQQMPNVSLPSSPWKGVEDQGWTIVNMWGKMWEMMNQQIEAGIIDIYDPYRLVAVKIGEALQKPFLDFNKILQGSSSFSNFFQKLTTPIKNFTTQMVGAEGGVTKFAKTAQQNISYFAGRASLSFWGVKEAWDRLQEAWTPRAGGGLLANLAGKVKGFGTGIKNLFRSMGAGAANALEPITSRAADAFDSIRTWAGVAAYDMGEVFRRVGKFSKNAFSNMANNAAAALMSMRINVFSIGRALREVGGGFASWGAALRKGVGQMGKGIRNTFSKIGPLAKRAGRGLANLTRPLRNNFAALGKFSASVFRGIGKTVGPVFRQIGGVMNKYLFRTARSGFNFMGRYAAGFGKIAVGAFAKVAGVLVGSLLPAIMAVVGGLLVMGGTAVIGGILALVGAILAVVQGALLMAPALVAAAGVSFAALKIGLEGVGEAVGQAFSLETAEEFEEAMSKLPHSVAEVARAFRTIKPAMDEMKRAVQDNLLEGLRPGIEQALGNLFPSISKGMQGLASEWNQSLKAALGELGSEEAGAGMANIMQNVVEMGKNMQPVIANLLRAFGSLADQGANWLPKLGNWISRITEGFADWAEGLREINEETGLSKFDEKMARSVVAAQALGDIFGGIGRTIGNITMAAFENSGGLVGGMAESMQDLADYTSRGNEGWENIVAFMDSAGRAAGLLSGILKPLLGAITDIGVALFEVGAGAAPGIADLATALDTALDPIKGLGNDFGRNIGDALGSFAPVLASLGTALAPVISSLGTGLSAMLTPLGNILSDLSPKVEDLGAAFAPLLQYAGESIGEIFEGLAPYIETTLNLLTALMEPLAQIFEYIGPIFREALLALAPIFTGHDAAVQALLANLGPVIDALGEGLLGTVEALRPALKSIGDAFGAIIESLAPLLPVIGEVVEVAFAALIDVINWLTPLIPPIAEAFATVVEYAVQALIPVIRAILEVFQHVWPIVASVVQGAISFILPILKGLIGFVVNVIFPAFMGLLNNIIIPVFTTIGQIIGTIINGVVIPIFHGIVTVVREVLGPIFSWLWEKIISPVFSWIGDKIGDVFGWMGDFFRGPVKDSLDWLGGAFEDVRDFITDVWNGLKKVFSDPITFLIETVINKGVVGGWNSVMGLINKKEEWGLEPIAVPSEMRFARGGVLPGYSPGYDDHHFYSRTGGHLHLSGGEAIMRPEWTRAVGGPKAVEAMNSDAKSGKLASRPQIRAHSDGGVIDHFASGGIVQPGVRLTTDVQRSMWDAVRTAFPTAQLSSGTRNWGTTSYHDRGLAIDLGGGWASDLQGIANWIASGYPHAAELFWDPGPNIKNGQPTGAIGGHSDHVHWAMTEMVDPYTGEVYASADGGGQSGGLGSLLRGAWDKIISPIKDGISSFIEPFGHYGKLALGFGEEVLSKGASALWEKVTELIPGWMRGGGGGADWEHGAGAEQWRDGVIAAFHRQGEIPTAERVDALLRQIESESGGNPNIAQQIVDMNGTGPSAGLGLYQFIPGTWAGYRDPGLPNDRTNPEAAHNAAVRYFRDRHNWNTGPGGVGRGHGWKDGGVLPEFDLGGLARGKGLLNKEIVTPERVLSPQQTRAFEQFVFGFMPELIRSYKDRPFEIRQAVDELIDGWNLIQTRANKDRRAGIEALSGELTSAFQDQAAGRRVTGTELDMDQLMDRFKGRSLNTVTPEQLMSDGRFLDNWYNQNQSRLKTNFDAAVRDSISIGADPHAYLEAERIAKERIDEADEAKKKEEDEKRREEEQKRKDEERDKRDEERNKILEGLSDEQKELKQAEFEREDEEREERERAEEERRRELEQAEQARINEMKESGEYYYGYKVLGDDGTNPNEYQDSPQVAEAKRYTEAAAEFAGMSDAYSGIMTRLQVLMSLNSGVETALPAWIAAANGDRSGLNHNIAAAHAANQERVFAEAQGIGPSLLFGLVESVSAATANKGPFIGTVQSGMTPGQLNSTLTHYEAQRARRGTGTRRTR